MNSYFKTGASVVPELQKEAPQLRERKSVTYGTIKVLLVLPLIMMGFSTWGQSDLIGITVTTPTLSAVPNEYIVLFKEEYEVNSSELMLSIESTAQVETLQKFTNINAALIETTQDSEATMQLLENDPRVESIEPNLRIRIDEQKPKKKPNDPGLAELWGFDNENDIDVDAPEAWEIATGGDVIVAVVDTGVDYNHEDLAANMWVNPGEVAGNGIDDDGNGYIDDVYGYDFINGDSDPMDDHYHGTHVAGTIAAVGNNETGVVGISWSAKIMALKIFDDSGNGTLSGAIAAINYAVGGGATISSHSWGWLGSPSESLKEAIKNAGEQGHLIVASAGNNSNDNDASAHYPSSYDLDNVIAVAATDESDNLASFSNYGKTSIDLAAPGVNIYSTSPEDSYMSLSGTSMATPIVAGAATLILSECSELTLVEVKKVIIDSVDKLDVLSEKTVSGGRLNVSSALGVCSVVGGDDDDDDDDDDDCQHAIYDAENRLVTLPYVDIDLFNPLTEQATGEVAMFKGSLELLPGVEDFQLISDTIEYLGMAADNNDCHATYSYADKTIHIPYLDVSSMMLLPSGISLSGPVQVYEVTLQQLQLSEDIFHLKEFNLITGE